MLYIINRKKHEVSKLSNLLGSYLLNFFSHLLPLLNAGIVFDDWQDYAAYHAYTQDTQDTNQMLILNSSNIAPQHY